VKASVRPVEMAFLRLVVVQNALHAFEDSSETPFRAKSPSAPSFFSMERSGPQGHGPSSFIRLSHDRPIGCSVTL